MNERSRIGTDTRTYLLRQMMFFVAFFVRSFQLKMTKSGWGPTAVLFLMDAAHRKHRLSNTAVMNAVTGLALLIKKRR